LKVKGSSMIDEQVRDGDCDRQRAPHGGQREMVIALLNGNAATMKRFYRERDGRIRLQPANEQMTPMYVHENDILVQGAVVGVIRKY
jgi:repressor LexA